jgi:hypothetical protein
VHFMFRPGLLYQSSEVESTAPPTPFDTETSKNLRISGELEVEAFLLDNFSVSASHGIAFNSFDPAGPGDKLTSFSTIGNNFTNIGFHVYLFGGGAEAARNYHGARRAPGASAPGARFVLNSGRDVALTAVVARG